MKPKQLRGYQLRRVKWLVRYAYENTIFYKRLYDGAGLHPTDINSLDDLRKFPITTKAMFAQSQADAPPFGEHLATPLHRVVRVNASTGSKGPALEPSTQNDVKMDTEGSAYALKLAGVGPGDVLAVTSNFSYVPSGLIWQLAGERIGCATIPVGVGARERLVETLCYAKVTVLNAFTSYCFQIAETAHEMGLDPQKDFSLRIMFIGGEPGGGFPSVRRRLQEKYGDVALFERYGTAELRLLGMECRAHAGFHVPEPLNYVEAVDGESGEPVSDGEEGVVVGTSLYREAWPLIRFRTEDISRIEEEPCSCGLSFRRLMGILGKTGGIARVKGILIYPEPIARAISEYPGLGEFQVLVTRAGDADQISIQIECEEDPDSRTGGELLEDLKRVMTITPTLEFVRPGTVSPDAKFKRILDNRQFAA